MTHGKWEICRPVLDAAGGIRGKFHVKGRKRRSNPQVARWLSRCRGTSYIHVEKANYCEHCYDAWGQSRDSPTQEELGEPYGEGN